MLTLTEHQSHFELVKKIPAQKAEAVQKAMIELLDSHILRSITPDRGKEFAQHHLVTEALGVKFYFPEPHQPWTQEQMKTQMGYFVNISRGNKISISGAMLIFNK